MGKFRALKGVLRDWNREVFGCRGVLKDWNKEVLGGFELKE